MIFSNVMRLFPSGSLSMLILLLVFHLKPSSGVQGAPERIRGGEPPISMTHLRQSGEGMIEERRFEEALTFFKKVVFLAPQDLGAMIRLADIYSWMGDYDHSISLYRDVVAQDTVNLAALKGLARVMRWAMRYSESTLYYERVLAIEPHDPDVLSGLAMVYAQQNNLERALSYVEEAEEMSPRNQRILITKGDILTWAHRFSEAEQTYHRALSVHPQTSEVYHCLGDLYRWSGRYAQSAEAFKNALALDPRNVGYLKDLADVALAADMFREAEEAVRELFIASPDDPDGYRILSEIESRRKVSLSSVMIDYVKPFVLILSIVGIAVYFHRRKHIIARRHPYFLRFTYFVLPIVIIAWAGQFTVSSIQGLAAARMAEELVEITTMCILLASFVSLLWVSRTQEPPKSKVVLAVGAHPDDIELGCGGTLVKFKEQGYTVYGIVVTNGEAGNPHFTRHNDRKREAKQGAGVLGLDALWVFDFVDTELSSSLVDIKNAIEKKIHETCADLIITQSPFDVHQDHKAVFEATKIAARGDKTILCYEDVSTEAHFVANFFVDVTDYIDDKIIAVQSHRTQRNKLYMHPENIRGRAAHRGLQAGFKYAEAFMLYKGVDTWTS